MRRGENRSTRRKTSQSKDENQQQTQPTFDAESGNRTGPHWWEACVGGEFSTTVTSLRHPWTSGFELSARKNKWGVYSMTTTTLRSDIDSPNVLLPNSPHLPEVLDPPLTAV